MPNQVGPQGWFPKNKEKFHRLGSLAEGINIVSPSCSWNYHYGLWQNNKSQKW